MSDRTPPRRTAAQRLQALYVRALLRLLPHLITLLRHVSPRIRAEVAYLAPGYTFRLSVRGTDLTCTCRRTDRGSFERIPPARVARDVEPGSGLASADADVLHTRPQRHGRGPHLSVHGAAEDVLRLAARISQAGGGDAVGERETVPGTCHSLRFRPHLRKRSTCVYTAYHLIMALDENRGCGRVFPEKAKEKP